MSNIEQTLSILKPDAVERNLDEKIKSIFVKEGFKIVKEKKIKTLIIGPGSGVNLMIKELVIRAIKEEIEFVLDADGLTSFEKNPNELFDLLRKRRKRNNIILTPHEGEFNRLFKFDNMNKIDKANNLTEDPGLILNLIIKILFS